MWGAIAYSSSTGRSGYSYHHGDRSSAEQAARDFCGAADAVIVISDGWRWIALAVASNGACGAGWGGNGDQAARHAENTCRQYGGQDPRIVYCFHTFFGPR